MRGLVVGCVGGSLGCSVGRLLYWGLGIHLAHNDGHKWPTSDTPSQWPVAGVSLVARLVC